MENVLQAIKHYLKSIEGFQSGENIELKDSALQELDYILTSSKGKELNNQVHSSTYDPKHESESFNSLIESIKNVTLDEDVVPYTSITKLIYEETKYKRELYDVLSDRLDNDWEIYQEKNSGLDNKSKRIFLKIKEHISLSSFQRNHLDDRMRKRLTDTMDKISEVNSEIKALSDELETVEKKAHRKADKLVVQFITILGIFSAIMMGTLGSFQGFTSIFSNAEKIPIGKILIISAAGASGVSLIIFLLLHAISKLTSFPLSNCDCLTKKRENINPIRLIARSLGNIWSDDNSEPECKCSLFNKYPTIFIVNYLFYYVAITGFVFMYFNFYNYFGMTIWKHILVISGFYFFFTSVLIIVHRYLIDKNTTEKSFYKFVKDIKKTPKYFKNAFKS